jgi:hypothetical protein
MATFVFWDGRRQAGDAPAANRVRTLFTSVRNEADRVRVPGRNRAKTYGKAPYNGRDFPDNALFRESVYL